MPLIDLDEPCGRYFKYRDLVECGKTWRDHAEQGIPIDNLPREQASVDALGALTVAVLDPLIEEFGSVTLTHGFAGPMLTRKINARIAPALDQHAAHELGRNRSPICPRGGAAVDLLVPGRAATEVARWIAGSLRFDRLYLYGDARPLHVSFGPETRRAIVRMLPGPSGRRVPRRISL
jgi:hypothetical protein